MIERDRERERERLGIVVLHNYEEVGNTKIGYNVNKKQINLYQVCVAHRA